MGADASVKHLARLNQNVFMGSPQVGQMPPLPLSHLSRMANWLDEQVFMANLVSPIESR